MALNSLEASLVAAVAFLVYLLVRYPNRAIGTARRPDLKPAFARSWPIIGDLPRLVHNADRALEHQLKNHLERHEVTSVTMPFLRMIFVNRPDWVQHLQKDNFDNYVKGDVQHSRFVDMLGNGIFAVDGGLWHRQRKASSHIFTAQSFRTVISASIDHHLAVLVKVLGQAADGHQVVPMNEIFFRFTLDSFVRMSFGKELGSLEAGRPVPFAEAFDFAQHRLNARFQDPIWSFAERFNSVGRRMRKAIKVVDDFTYDIIDERDRAEKEDGSTDLLSLYRNVRDEKGEGMSRKELRDAVLNLILAGRDTTAQVLSWSMFYIARNPELLDPVRKEIEELLPNGAKVDYDNYKSLIHTSALFQEVLRLHPSVPKNGKTAVNDDVLPNGGPIVRAGDVVGWSDWVMARDPEIWGEDAAELKPSRWIDEDGKTLRKFSQWQAHAFNGGPRLCLGQNLAIYEGTACLVALARNFDFAFAPSYLDKTPMTGSIVKTGPFPTPLYANSVTLPMRDTLELTVTRREKT